MMLICATIIRAVPTVLDLPIVVSGSRVRGSAVPPRGSRSHSPRCWACRRYSALVGERGGPQHDPHPLVGRRAPPDRCAARGRLQGELDVIQPGWGPPPRCSRRTASGPPRSRRNGRPSAARRSATGCSSTLPPRWTRWTRWTRWAGDRLPLAQVTVVPHPAQACRKSRDRSWTNPNLWLDGPRNCKVNDVGHRTPVMRLVYRGRSHKSSSEHFRWMNCAVCARQRWFQSSIQKVPRLMECLDKVQRNWTSKGSQKLRRLAPCGVPEDEPEPVTCVDPRSRAVSHDCGRVAKPALCGLRPVPQLADAARPRNVVQGHRAHSDWSCYSAATTRDRLDWADRAVLAALIRQLPERDGATA